MASYSPFPGRLEPENAIEQSDLALCIISGQGELRCRDPPMVVNQQNRGICMIFVTFVALPEETFRLFVCNYGSCDVGADVSFGGEFLGKWLIACEPQAWHHIACDSLFQFHKSYDLQSKVFEPTTIEIRLQYLHKVEVGSQQASPVPIIQRQPSPKEGPVDLGPRNDVMQSTFTALEEDQFLTFVILFYPPVPMTIFPPLQTTPLTGSESGSHVSSPSSESGSTRSSDSISQMSDDELQEALTEHKDSRLLLPARLTPGFWGKLPVENFCHRYELPEEIASVLTQMKVKDAHGLSSVYLRDLRDNGLAHRSISMLRLAVIRFSSESMP